MKKIIVACLLLLSFFICAAGFAADVNSEESANGKPSGGMIGLKGKKSYEMINPEGYEGYWLEKAEGKLILSVTPSEEDGWYEVTIARKDKLPKMDVYLMKAHYQKDGSMYYENGLFVSRKINKNGTVKDKVKYRNGSGLLYYSFDENVLYWTDYTKKPQENVKLFIRTAAPESEEEKE